MSVDATLVLPRFELNRTVQMPAEMLAALGGPCTRESLDRGVDPRPDYRHVVADIRAKVATTPLTLAASQYLEHNLGTPDLDNASDQELHDFHGRHINNLRALGLTREQAAEVESARLGHIQAVDRTRWISKHAAATAVRVERVEVLVGNAWDYWLNDGGYAYHDLGQTYVVVSLPDGGKNPKAIWRPLWHEFNHVQFDTDRIDELPDWFVEGMATHVEYGLAHGHPEIIDPLERRKLYPDEVDHEAYRSFLAVILGQNGLWRPGIQAYTSPSGSGEWAAFHSGLDAEWGRDALHEFNADIIRRQAAYVRQYGSTFSQFRYSYSQTAASNAAEYLRGRRHMPAGRHTRIKKLRTI